MLLIFSVLVKTTLLDIDGETPNPFGDNAGNNGFTAVENPYSTTDAIDLPTGDDYLRIDSFLDFNMQQNWSVEFSIRMTNPMGRVFPIKWRRSSMAT